MKQSRRPFTGHIVGLGFSLTILISLFIVLDFAVVYRINQNQRQELQRRQELQNLSLHLENLAIQRAESVRRYLETEETISREAQQGLAETYQLTYEQIMPLLTQQTEADALYQVSLAENILNNKIEELLRLRDSGFPAAARLVWTEEGQPLRDELVETIQNLERVESEISQQFINQAQQTEQRSVQIAMILAGLALIVGLAAAILITRSITLPISHLVETINAIGSDLTIRVNPTGPKEIAFLGQTINDMAANLLQSRQELEYHKERMEKELVLAGQIQASFLPSTLPQVAGWDLAVFWQPAREVGGDFYTHLTLPNNQVILAVADARGKGAPAAMAGALVMGLLEAYVGENHRPEMLLNRLNKSLQAHFQVNKMNAACSCLLLQPNTPRLSVANAGLIAPYLYRPSGGLQEVSVYGIPLGINTDFDYLSQTLTLAPGDCLLLYSDGLVEAINANNELFGFDRLETLLSQLSPQAEANTIVNHLVDHVFGFMGHIDPQDDITIVVARIPEN